MSVAATPFYRIDYCDGLAPCGVCGEEFYFPDYILKHKKGKHAAIHIKCISLDATKCPVRACQKPLDRASSNLEGEWRFAGIGRTIVHHIAAIEAMHAIGFLVPISPPIRYIGVAALGFCSFYYMSQDKGYSNTDGHLAKAVYLVSSFVAFYRRWI